MCEEMTYLTWFGAIFVVAFLLSVGHFLLVFINQVTRVLQVILMFIKSFLKKKGVYIGIIHCKIYNQQKKI